MAPMLMTSPQAVVFRATLIPPLMAAGDAVVIASTPPKLADMPTTVPRIPIIGEILAIRSSRPSRAFIWSTCSEMV